MRPRGELRQHPPLKLETGRRGQPNSLHGAGAGMLDVIKLYCFVAPTGAGPLLAVMPRERRQNLENATTERTLPGLPATILQLQLGWLRTQTRHPLLSRNRRVRFLEYR